MWGRAERKGYGKTVTRTYKTATTKYFVKLRGTDRKYFLKDATIYKKAISFILVLFQPSYLQQDLVRMQIATRACWVPPSALHRQQCYVKTQNDRFVHHCGFQSQRGLLLSVTSPLVGSLSCPSLHPTAAPWGLVSGSTEPRLNACAPSTPSPPPLKSPL